MERLADTRPSGLSNEALKVWGMLFVIAGLVSRSILQVRLLGIGSLTGQQLLELMSSSQSSMALATAALVLQALETCAIPIFAFLLVEGFCRSKSRRQYFLRVAGVAAVSEIPYNLASGLKFLDPSSRNPVFALLIGMLLLYFFQRYAAKGLRNTLLKLCVAAAAVLWVGILRIEHGLPILLMIGVFWIFRNKKRLLVPAGSAAAIACSMVSLFYLISPFGLLPVHMYNGEQRTTNRLIHYLAYPVVALVIGLTAKYLI